MSKNTSKAVVKVKSAHPTTTNLKSLTPKEEAEFEKLEQQIEDNLDASFKLAAALFQIRDSKLYRAEYKTFEEYCNKRWDYGRSYCARLADMNGVLADLREEYEESDVFPRNEAQARVFVPLDRNQRLKLAKTVVEQSKDDVLTASVLTKYKRELFPDQNNAAPKKKAHPTIDVEIIEDSTQASPRLVKVVKLATKAHQTMVDEGYKGELKDILQEFIKEAEPLVACKDGKKAKGK